MITSFKYYVTTCLMCLYFCTSAQNRGDKDLYNLSNFESLYQIFCYKADLMRFLDIRPGDMIGDVGAGDGKYEGALSCLYDSITLYAEDISRKSLTQKSLDKALRHYSKVIKKPITNPCYMSIGTYTSTNLPPHAFDKILMIASYHEFSNKPAMMADLAQKMKPGGTIYFLESFSIGNKFIHCETGDTGARISDIEEVMKKEGYYLTRMKSPESSIVDYTNALAFEKDSVRGSRFRQQRAALLPYTDLVIRLNQPAIASDLQRCERIADSLAPVIKMIDNNYYGFEAWITSLAIKWLNKKEYAAAVNILNVSTMLYPASYHCYNELGNAYEALADHNDSIGNSEAADDQRKLALNSYKRSLELYPQSESCAKKVRNLSGQMVIRISK